ncbi:MAG: alanine racemase [Candidatus Omnitrophica bacterium]|nr:alanine racemase [Candidatus Omnitrophota bacterium]
MRNNQHIGYRPTWAQINLKAIEHNIQQIKKLIAPGVKIMPTVKADAYGHGLVPVSKRLIECGVDYLGVASIDEGIRLRSAGVRAPILILGMILPKDIEPLFMYNLIPTVCTEEFARALNTKARLLNKRCKVHIKVDTGMGRIGVLHYDAFHLVKKIFQFRHLLVEGMFTHFAFADMDKHFTMHQLDLFNRLVERLKHAGMHIPLLHCANSMGAVRFRHSHKTMVRPGLIVYGLKPSQAMRVSLSLKPALSLKTRIVYMKRVPKGSGISYGHTYTTKRATTIVTLPIGYGDGYPRNLSNKASVLIRGKRFKISGRVCMDQIMVDVGSFPVSIGDEVVLIGSQGRQRISAEELAFLADTIPYEIVCGLGSRIPRIYLG